MALAREYLALGDEVILTDVHAEPPPAVQELVGRWTSPGRRHLG